MKINSTLGFEIIKSRKVLMASALVSMLCATPTVMSAGKWDVNGYLENSTIGRGHGVGLVRSRNRAQIEVARNWGKVGIFSNFGFNGTFRGSYDAAYHLNDDTFGDKAGGPLAYPTTPYGGGIPLFGAQPGVNDGLIRLGSTYHNGNALDSDGFNSDAFVAVPVRPCDVDSRGCIDGYMDDDEQELYAPEFNDRLDFIREAYFTGSIPMKNGAQLDLSFGRQQVVWGRTDLFRVLDVINPVDYSQQNIYEELEDARIPMGIFTAEYRAGATKTFDDLNFQLMWKWEQFRPHDLGQAGQPYAILDAGPFFRALGNCWDNGCTFGNFPLAPGVRGDVNFGPQTIGIRQANVHDWDIDETDIGARIEGVFKGVGFSLNALYYNSQLPSLRGGIPSVNPFTGATAVHPYIFAFDIDFPRIFMMGGSADFYVDPMKTAFRVEVAHTSGEEFANTNRTTLFSESNVLRWVVGADRSTFIPFLNKRRAFLFSAQVFGQHILDHELVNTPFGTRGMPDWENNFITTLLVKGWYKNDRLSPQIISAYDVRAQSFVTSPSIDWLVSDNWRITAWANLKFGTGAREFDDDLSACPFPPVCGPAAAAAGSGPFQTFGYEPLGRFRAGPIGVAHNEDEVGISVRYRF